LLAKALAVGPERGWRELRCLGMSLQRRRSWCVSTDPQFAQKAADVAALILLRLRHTYPKFAQQRRTQYD
jgi:hypothetical protein